MRCFIAIDIDEGIRKQIALLQGKLQQRLSMVSSGVKWVRPDNIHLTLKFLGEITDGQLVQVCDIVSQTAAAHDRFDIAVENLGVFGNPARVLWLGADSSQQIISLQHNLDEYLSQAGFAADNKKFTGHLTLCRIKSASAGKKLADVVAEYGTVNFGSAPAEAICVYKSELTSGGPLYTLISKNPMKQ